MKRAVALMLSVGMFGGGCFPHNPKARTYAKYTEGALILAGIGAEAIASRKTGATCDQMSRTFDSSCHSTSTIYGGVGLALILAGLTGFIATVSTAEDEEKAAEPPLVEVKAKPEKPDVKLPPGVSPTPTNTPAPAATPADAAPTGGTADAPQKPAP